MTPQAEPPSPSYDWGMRVIALDDLLNDGTHPDGGRDGCLVEAGTIGEIVNVGRMVDSGQAVYLVEFDQRVVGCTEDEIAPLPADLLARLQGLAP